MNNDLFYKQGNKYILTDLGLQTLIQDYNLGYSQIKLTKKFEVSEDTIRHWMKENNIPTRKRKYKINEDYFQDLKENEFEKAYWLGFLSADGYVNNQRGELQLELQESDNLHLEKFKKAIECNKPLMEIHCGDKKQFLHWRFVIKCKKMTEDLKQYNIIQNKSLIFEPPQLPSSLIPYWILGYMDGDGCIYESKGRLKMSFAGTKKTLEFIREYLHSTNKIILARGCENTYSYTAEVQIGEDFLKKFEYNKLPFVLNRKQQRYCSFIQ